MHHRLTLICLLLAVAVCALPVAALTVEVSGSTAGSAVTVTCDEEAFVIFQENNGTPIFVQGRTVRYIPYTTGTLSVTATAGGETTTRSVAIAKSGGGEGPGNGGGGGDSDSTVWKDVYLGSGTFNVTAESGKSYSVDRRTALGALDASGASYVIRDSWYAAYGTLYLTSVNGRAGQGTSGWMYQVNGVSPAVGANSHHVNNGDKVVFYYSESMSATPETSTDPIYLKVVFGSGSSDGGDSESAGTGTVASPGPATGPVITLGLPAGVSIVTEGGMSRITVDTTPRNTGEQVTVKGDRIIIARPGLLMTVLTGDITQTNGVASGFIRGVTAELDPVTGTIEGIGEVGGRISLSLRGVPAEAQVNVTYVPALTPAVRSAIALVAADEEKGIGAVACVMHLEKTGIANGEDILGATIRISVPPAWVEEHGGAGAVRIAHIADNGAVEFLETHQAGTDSAGNPIFEAESPSGLSGFALLALGEKEAPVNATDPTAPPSTEAPPATTTPQKTPIGIFTVFTGVLIGIGAYMIRKRDD
ncbi:DUF4430 domain-containing protein [Methanofollis ethanolicus]|uniref:DUF4430 domain-containing protein n=1 Tax=Methanofollis ethanolicus TaxID=488124 RepID=UPI0008351BE3|nr:DUF4430 domain-containing protein [Methanofollis ethanolicus]